MEIERKFLIKRTPFDPARFSAKEIVQAYLSTDPVIRIRRVAERCGDHAVSDGGEAYELTVKGRGLMTRQEINLPLSKESYTRLLAKADGSVIKKTRYLVPLSDSQVCELDIFKGSLDGLMLAEVEFGSEAEADLFTPPDWFGQEVTFDPAYQNCNLVKGDFS